MSDQLTFSAIAGLIAEGRLYREVHKDGREVYILDGKPVFQILPPIATCQGESTHKRMLGDG